MANNEINYDFTNGNIVLTSAGTAKTLPNKDDANTWGGVQTFGNNLRANMRGFAAYASAAQTLSDGVITKLQLDTEEFDSDAWFDSVTNYRFTPQLAGKYMIGGTVSFVAAGSGERKQAIIYKNGALHKKLGASHSSATSNITAEGSAIVVANGTTDYFEVYAATIGAADDTVPGVSETFFWGVYLGS